MARGHGTLAEQLIALAQSGDGPPAVVIDGFGGVFWAELRRRLDMELRALGVAPTWLDVSSAWQAPAAIAALVEPFLGGDDPLFGTRFTGALGDFFRPDALDALVPDATCDLTILYGCGAALAGWSAPLVYVDVPKNELQFRARAGSIANLGMTHALPPKTMYKRFYFVDWPALNQHKCALLPRIDLIIDGQRPDDIVWLPGADLRAGLTAMSHSFFRVRPWFEPGPWGGQWIKEQVPELPQDVPNYAWSFELIVPENGLMFSSNGLQLEVSFDFLMYHDYQAVLGDCADQFGYEFPIRFDFLDTFDGGNLSLQCHPSTDFIRRHFGETFTQDETYYILDCKPGAQVYLGFREDIQPAAFRTALEQSFAAGTAIDVADYVNIEPAHKHDLFLIPNSTIHCAGSDTMVLEISATPYIFTFKMYDWQRLDLDGRPRPLNIDRAFQNLDFTRQGERVARELIAQPIIIDRGDDWQLVHLPTHPDHFYDVHRWEFSSQVETDTDGSCHIMSLVQGTAVLLETADGRQQRFAYAETFVVPAAARRYRLTNQGAGPAMVIKAYMKSPSG